MWGKESPIKSNSCKFIDAKNSFCILKECIQDGIDICSLLKTCVPSNKSVLQKLFWVAHFGLVIMKHACASMEFLFVFFIKLSLSKCTLNWSVLLNKRNRKTIIQINWIKF